MQIENQKQLLNLESVIEFRLTPIGYIRSSALTTYELPRQATKQTHSHTYIELLPEHNFEQSIQDLNGFSYIWIIAYFEGNIFTKPKVLTPLSREKKGVFATRSPHRPNPIGISAVPLIGIEGRNIIIGANDYLDGTPILDIKPYLPHADAFPTAKIGWMEGLLEPVYTIEIANECEGRWNVFQEVSPTNYEYIIELLQKDPFPHSYRRIRELHQNHYLLAVKLWRITYAVEEMNVTIIELACASEYDIDQAKCQGYPTSYFEEIELFLQKTK